MSGPKYVQVIIVSLLCAYAASITISHDNVTVFSEIYHSPNTIVKIIVPTNILLLKETLVYTIPIFFVEADVKSDGQRIDKGLFALRNGTAKKILKYGRDATATHGDSVFFAAKGGIFKYTPDNNRAKKYGSITMSIVAIERLMEGDIFYVLAETGRLYKITNDGTEKTLVDKVTNAQQFVLDSNYNIYYTTKQNKQINILTPKGTKTVKGLPKEFSSIKILRPYSYIKGKEVPIAVDNVFYWLEPDGSFETLYLGFDLATFNLTGLPDAWCIEAMYVMYVAFGGHMFEYDTYALTMGPDLVEETLDAIGYRPRYIMLDKTVSPWKILPVNEHTM